MNQAEQQWLENRIDAAVGDDYYLDRDEEKGIKEEGAAKGITVKDIEIVLRTELDKQGAVSERILLDELDRLLRQFTDNDKKLDNKEERDALDKVLRAAPGKKKGLDPRAAEVYVSSFCKVNGVVRTTDRNRFAMPVALAIAVLVLVGGYLLYTKTGIVTGGVGLTVKLKDNDKSEIDDLLRRAVVYADKSQYTDPPEKSAKACIDCIKQIDPNGEYRGDEVKLLAQRIVGHYISLAEKRYANHDNTGATKWLERAKLLNADMETIRDKEREFGFIKEEK